MRAIVLSFDDQSSELPITRLTREKLYGKKRRVIVDDEGEECVSAMLTRDGAALLPSGTTAYLYVDDNDDVVERRDLEAVDAEGNPMESVESTLGVEVDATPVEPERVLEHVVSAVYQIDVEGIADSLMAALEDGQVFEFRFNYRKGFEDWPAFLLQNSEGVFCLVCEEAAFDMLRREEELPDEEDDEDPFEDDLDFSML